MEDLSFTKENTLFKAEVNNWEEGVKVAGQLLVKQGCVKPEYVDNIIKAIKNYGPYVVIADGIAIPHTRPDEGALETGCALVTLKEPVCFEDDDTKVHVLIAFSAVDNNKHLDLLKTIVEFIELGLIEDIAKVDNYDEFLQLCGNSIK